ncbi:hypothetical protein THASP1DRAFT_30669 [Thamnocephalis sphaerospora]|uniref:JmjC domain-containing protein n=1 Tax=Thamnocephalis sphaerospora TaxID=78915 RepID=A0A4P9XNH1_9FUNG|nr:hypothetical protein THASP1DRAFT_30669 [Thamnocephalis sphaerospora]|eukprot:RKP07513.1 hypothetical protein THASP1DRAFT_30669 [Thamnocephalis sphaerospora]
MTSDPSLEQQRSNSLGSLCVLTDQLLCEHLLSRLSDVDLIRFGACSRWCYVFSHQEPHWRQRFLERILRRHREEKQKQTKDATEEQITSPTKDIEDTITQADGATAEAKSSRPAEGITLFDGSWFSTMLRWMRGDRVPDEMLSAPLYNTTAYRRFDGAPGECWPVHIAAVRSWYTYAEWQLANTPLDYLGVVYAPPEMQLDLVPCAALSVEQFQREYNATSTPVLLDGLATNWTASGEWTTEKLAERFRDTSYRASMENAGPRPDQLGRFHMRMQDYVRYCRLQQDASPIYVFDAEFGERAPAMLSDYKVPGYFQHDYFELLGDKLRPPYRWFVMGPARSGASWHIDPAGTSAWNTLLSGRKRWALYPGNIVPPGVRVIDKDEGSFESPDSPYWYREVYPTLPPDLRPLECIQESGQTIFVPGGWWHMVLNLNETVAVTQNFADDHNLELVCSDICGNPKIFTPFLEKMNQAHPHLAPFLAKYSSQGKTSGDRIIADEGYGSRDEFSDSFRDLAVWRPRCEQIVERHALCSKACGGGSNDASDAKEHSCDIEALSTGQNPVFCIDKQYVVKLYAHLVSGYPAYKMESSILEHLSLDSTAAQGRFPTIIARGHLRCGPNCQDTHEKDEQNSSAESTVDASADGRPLWQWPYIVMSHQPGTPLQELLVDDRENEVNWKQLIPWLAETVAELHAGSAGSSKPKHKGSSAFRMFLLKRTRQCHARHQEWLHLPQWLIDEIPKYIAPFVCWLKTGHLKPRHSTERKAMQAKKHAIQRMDRVLSRGRVIHGDLNAVNVLGKLTSTQQTTYGSLWEPTALIDFADAMRDSDPLWDIVPLYVSILGGDKERLAQFFGEYLARIARGSVDSACLHPSPSPSDPSYLATILHRMRLSDADLHYPFPIAYVLMCYTLLWPFEGLVRWLVAENAELCACPTLHALAGELWPTE